MDYLTSLETTTELREPLLKQIIQGTAIEAGSTGLDVGFGIGVISNMLMDKMKGQGKITGIDLSQDFVDYAYQHNAHDNIEFLQADVNRLDFAANSFDWIWSMDALWAGPQEKGCAAEDTSEIISNLYDLVKPGGKIYLAFWTSQKMLPGYPLLEARLMATESANFPWSNKSHPNSHVLNVKHWLTKAGFNHVTANSFAGDISPPFTDKSRQAAEILLKDMFWAGAKEELSEEDWQEYNRLCNPESVDCVLNSAHYQGIYTYTLFQAEK